MALPSRDVKAGSNFTVQLESSTTDLFFYKSIGADVSVLSNRQERKWWCLWLCKRPIPMRAEIIDIENEYYVSPGAPAGGPVVVPALSRSAQCRNTDSCSQSESAFGILIKGPSISVGQLTDPLPLIGVVSRAAVRVAGQSFNLSAGAGTQPP
jgi:hypothetical protein